MMTWQQGGPIQQVRNITILSLAEWFESLNLTNRRLRVSHQQKKNSFQLIKACKSFMILSLNAVWLDSLMEVWIGRFCFMSVQLNLKTWNPNKSHLRGHYRDGRPLQNHPHLSAGNHSPVVTLLISSSAFPVFRALWSPQSDSRWLLLLEPCVSQVVVVSV